VSAVIHPSALVETDAVGEGTNIAAFVRVATGATVGANCSVDEQAFVDGDASLADDVTLGVGARLLGHVQVGTGVKVAANAVLGQVDSAEDDRVVVGRGASIGANATVLSGLTIGRGAVVAPGSVVESDVPAHAVVRGSPARIVSYVDAIPEPTEPEIDLSSLWEPTKTGVDGVVLYPLTYARDLRGSLSALEFEGLPFAPRRMFAVYGVPDESVRGAHAHRRCGQLLVCMSGEARCIADDGRGSRQAFVLSTSKAGLYLPSMVWGMQYGYTHDACLVVLAELPYDPDDYIRDYEEFVALVESADTAR
jgi:acetyltransferase-like isoleucine patch superfamily enzyme/dTDP-4-dehydrorhamnose 3,5-epimerase-like enzyme